MKLQLLVSAVNQEPETLIESMNIRTDAIIVNQCDKHDYREFSVENGIVRFYSFKERGVGLSRNNALLRASEDLVLFSDEDIVYDDDYEQKVSEAFAMHPEADMLLFNMDVCESRRTYDIRKFGRVHWYNCGRYPTYSFAARRERLHKAGVTYSLLFGGGAKYSAGEDSLFIRDCLKKGLRIYCIPVKIGREQERESTWFRGYNEKYFFDRGVLYHFLYGKLAIPMSWRLIVAKKSFMCKEISAKKALALMKKGILHAKNM